MSDDGDRSVIVDGAQRSELLLLHRIGFTTADIAESFHIDMDVVHGVIEKHMATWRPCCKFAIIPFAGTKLIEFLNELNPLATTDDLYNDVEQRIGYKLCKYAWQTVVKYLRMRIFDRDSWKTYAAKCLSSGMRFLGKIVPAETLFIAEYRFVAYHYLDDFKGLLQPDTTAGCSIGDYKMLPIKKRLMHEYGAQQLQTPNANKPIILTMCVWMALINFRLTSVYSSARRGHRDVTETTYRENMKDLIAQVRQSGMKPTRIYCNYKSSLPRDIKFKKVKVVHASQYCSFYNPVTILFEMMYERMAANLCNKCETSGELESCVIAARAGLTDNDIRMAYCMAQQRWSRSYANDRQCQLQASNICVTNPTNEPDTVENMLQSITSKMEAKLRIYDGQNIESDANVELSVPGQSKDPSADMKETNLPENTNTQMFEFVDAGDVKMEEN